MSNLPSNNSDDGAHNHPHFLNDPSGPGAPPKDRSFLPEDEDEEDYGAE